MRETQVLRGGFMASRQWFSTDNWQQNEAWTEQRTARHEAGHAFETVAVSGTVTSVELRSAEHEGSAWCGRAWLDDARALRVTLAGMVVEANDGEEIGPGCQSDADQAAVYAKALGLDQAALDAELEDVRQELAENSRAIDAIAQELLRNGGRLTGEQVADICRVNGVGG